MTKATDCKKRFEALIDDLYMQGAPPATIVLALAEAAVDVSYFDIDNAAIWLEHAAAILSDGARDFRARTSTK